MNNEQLKDGIRATIKENGVNAITGELLQQVLIAMVNALGTGYQFVGMATPTTIPIAGDNRVFYVATQAGQYEHFGVTIASGEIVFLTYDTDWHKVTIATNPFIRYDILQSLTESQKAMARDNIGAQSTDKMQSVLTDSNTNYPSSKAVADYVKERTPIVRGEGSESIQVSYSSNPGRALGNRAISFGSLSVADANNSVVFGVNTKTQCLCGMATGSNNVVYSNGIFEVGIGIAGNRKNAQTITRDGKHYIPGIGGYDGTQTDLSQVKDLATVLSEIIQHIEL